MIAPPTRLLSQVPQQAEEITETPAMQGPFSTGARLGDIFALILPDASGAAGPLPERPGLRRSAAPSRLPKTRAPMRIIAVSPVSTS
jgi:hypothetical protein